MLSATNALPVARESRSVDSAASPNSSVSVPRPSRRANSIEK